MESFVEFLKANAVSLFTLLGVLIGSSIPFWTNKQNLAHQSIERDKDRQEQRREAWTHSREKWIERDILKIADLLEKMSKSLSDLSGLGVQMDFLLARSETEIFKKEENEQKFKSLYANIPNLDTERKHIWNLISSLVRSFTDDEILSSYREIDVQLDAYVNQVVQEIFNKLEDEKKSNVSDRDKVNESIGKLQRALRNKLISIRDS